MPRRAPFARSCRNAEPVWRRLGGVRPAAVPEAAWSWITEPGSLTRRVQDGCDGVFDLRLLRQAGGEALPSERRLLRADRHGRDLIREVELLCDGAPRIFARTVMPARSLIGRARELSRLGTRPLGAVLFATRARAAASSSARACRRRTPCSPWRLRTGQASGRRSCGDGARSIGMRADPCS